MASTDPLSLHEGQIQGHQNEAHKTSHSWKIVKVCAFPEPFFYAVAIYRSQNGHSINLDIHSQGQIQGHQNGTQIWLPIHVQ